MYLKLRGGKKVTKYELQVVLHVTDSVQNTLSMCNILLLGGLGSGGSRGGSKGSMEPPFWLQL